MDPSWLLGRMFFPGNQGGHDNRNNRLSLATVAPELDPAERRYRWGVLCYAARYKSSCWTSQILCDSHHQKLHFRHHSYSSQEIQLECSWVLLYSGYLFCSTSVKHISSKVNSRKCVSCTSPMLYTSQRHIQVHCPCIMYKTYLVSEHGHITGLKINKPVRQEDPNEINVKEWNFHLLRTSGHRANQPFNAAHWTCKWQTVWKGPEDAWHMEIRWTY